MKSKTLIAANLFAGLLLGTAGCTTAPVSQVQTESPVSIIQYDARSHPVIANAGMVVSQNKTASEVGRDILAKGGNAVDAAVATGFALAVTLPRAGNIGGSGFMLVHLADAGQTIALDYRSAAPMKFDLEKYRKPDGNIDVEALTYGPDTAGVPGTVAGLYEAWERFGSLPWGELVAPAIELARQGIIVSDDLAYVLENSGPTFEQYPSSAATYMQADGSRYLPQQLFKQPDLAESLSLIAEHGRDGFYTGELAAKIVEGVTAAGGSISAADLERYQAKYRDVISTDYRGYKVYSMPPASGGGLALLQMLNILSEFDVERFPEGGSESYHLLAEVMKLGAANRRAGIGDPDFVQVPVEGFLSRKLAHELANSIDLRSSRATKDIEPADAEKYESRDTTHFSIVDQFGNAVSNTYTLGYSFGSGFVVPGTGILLDNQMRNFKLSDPEHANALVGGKRMASSMTPTLVLDEEGKVVLVTGSPGGSRIINVVLQIIVNVLDYDMNIEEATVAPRIHQSWRGAPLYLEPGITRDTVSLLEARGHDIRWQRTMGSTQSVMVKDGLYFGAADPRRPNAGAVGYQR